MHRRGDDLRNALVSGRLQQRAQAAGAGNKRGGIHAQSGVRQGRTERKNIGSERGRRVVSLRRHMAKRAAARGVGGSAERRQLKIEQINIGLGEYGIRQFQIAVDDAQPMQFGDGSGETRNSAADLAARQSVECKAIDVLNDNGASIRSDEPWAFEIAARQKRQKPAFVFQPRAAIDAGGILGHAAPHGLDYVCVREILAGSEKGIALRRRLQRAEQQIAAAANGQLAVARLLDRLRVANR